MMQYKSKFIPIGVKAISILLGLNSVIAFFAGIMRFILKDKYPQNEPGWILAFFLIGIAFYFAWLSFGLWKYKNKARIATLITAILIFSLITISLIQRQIFPDLMKWWHYYIYPAIICFLLAPAVRGRFKNNLKI